MPSSFNSNRFREAAIRDEPWFGAFMREMAATVFANAFAIRARRPGERTLYNSVLGARVAERVAPLDGGLSPRFVGVVPVADASEPWKAVDEAVNGALGGMPRGAWAVFRTADGGCDAFMSDGLGGFAMPHGGHRFEKVGETAFSFWSCYAGLVESLVYEVRREADLAISRATAEAFRVAPGERVPNPHNLGVHVGGKTHDAVAYAGRAGDLGLTVSTGDPRTHVLRCSRRGRRTVFHATDDVGLASLYGAPAAMPGEWLWALDDPRRLSTQDERRAAAAAEASAGRPIAAARPPRLWEWRPHGPDLVRRSVWAERDAVRSSEPVAMGFEVARFDPGSDVVRELLFVPVGQPAPAWASAGRWPNAWHLGPQAAVDGPPAAAFGR